MTDTLIQRIKDLTARFGKGWHDGIQIDASDIADLCLAADALEQQAAQINRMQIELNAQAADIALRDTEVEALRAALANIAKLDHCRPLIDARTIARAALRQEQPNHFPDAGKKVAQEGPKP